MARGPAIDKTTRLVLTDHQITSQLGDESVILELNAGIYYGLDSIGTRIWSLIESPRSVQEICDIIEQEYDVEPAACEQAVLSLLQELEAKSLVERRQ